MSHRRFGSARATSLVVAFVALALPVSQASAGGYFPASASTGDGAGGAIVVWEDSRYLERNIYGQHLDAAGNRQWPDTGVVICNAPGDQVSPLCVSDGAGGAIVSWTDGRAGTQVFAQRIDGAGVTHWTLDGVPVGPPGGTQFRPCITADGSGGAILAWSDNRGALSGLDIFAQRLSVDGVPQWTLGGVPVSVASNGQYDPRIVSDGLGGAVVTWTDVRSGTSGDVYAQRLDGAGAAQWTTDGVALASTPTTNDASPRLASDGAGGAIVAWYGDQCCSPAESLHVRVQHVEGSGALPWGANGVGVTNAPTYQTVPIIVPDAGGGAIVVWRDGDPVTHASRVAAQRVDGEGATLWGPTGVSASGGFGSNYEMLPAGGEGAFLAIEDYQRGYPLGPDILAQRLDAAGVTQWGADAPVCMAPGVQRYPSASPDGAGGMIAAWEDFRDQASGGDSSVYAQRLDGSGVAQWTTDGVRVYFFPRDLAGVGPSVTRFELAPLRPNPAVGPLSLAFSLASSHTATLELLDVRGRRLAERELAMGTGRHTLQWDVPHRPGIYFVRLSQDARSVARKVCVLN